MKVDPAIVQIHAENVRAEVLPPTTGKRLDPAVVEKIKRNVPIFAGMPPDYLMSTLAVADHFAVQAGEPVFNEGDIGGAFYVLVAGEVRVEKLRHGTVVELARLGPGECFGEMALVGSHTRSATVRALRDSVAMRFDCDKVDANAQSAHFIYRNIARVLAARLGESSVQLAALMEKTQSL
ncbi:MAG: cyclic nucleotide-binding domain-containing protein [Rhodoferax sp.]|nr:cyclic nucleotide-binding domain-containing protein [Rhodoferax sp.]